MHENRHLGRPVFLTLLVFGLAGGPALAGEIDLGTDDFGDDMGFGDDRPVAPPPIPEESPWSLTGFLRSDWSLWVERFDSNPLAKARQSGDVSLRYKRGILRLQVTAHAELDIAYFIDAGRFDGPTKGAYQGLMNTREALIALSLGPVELTLGRQIVAWGVGDFQSPLDVVNPRDLREPGLADLDDLRLAVLATRAGIFSGSHRLELMMIHEADFGYRSPPRGPYSPLGSLISQDPGAAQVLAGKTIQYEHVQDRFDLDNQQYLLRWMFAGQGVDLGAYWASVLDQNGVLSLPANPAVLLAADPLTIDLDHRRFHVVGMSAALPLDDFLVKWELAQRIDVPLNAGNPPLLLRVERADIFSGLLGVTWTGVQDLTVALEFVKPFVLRGPDDPFFDLEAPSLALRVSYLALAEKLRLNLAFSMIGWTADQGWIVRADFSYELMDALHIDGGFITYQPGDELGPFFGLETHDQIFIGLRWDFQLL